MNNIFYFPGGILAFSRSLNFPSVAGEMNKAGKINKGEMKKEK